MDRHFSRGPYGEILPPPLVAGLAPEEALAQLERDAAAGEQPITHMPTRGHSRKGMMNLAMMYVHQLTLKRALAGQSDDPDAQALYQAVVEEGEPLSLRPVGLESLTFLTFAPVLRRLEGTRWRVGLPEGRTILLEGSPEAVLEQAWGLYARWCEEEDARFAQAADQMIARTLSSLNHEVWGGLLRQGQEIVVAHAVSIRWLGKHTTFLLTTPKGQRVVNVSSPERAARLAEALAHQARAAVCYPAPDQALQALLAAGDLSEPAAHEGGWRINGLSAQWKGGKPLAVIVGRSARYVLTRASGEVALSKAGESKPLARSALAPNLVGWLENEPGRRAFLAWAAGKLVREEIHG